MPTALFLSPHLDDVAFSCGGLVAQLGDAGWRTVMATAFTRSVPDPTGFALACQTDKGLGPEVDYMALRREEDRAAAAILGTEPRWLDLPEAPHRGYGSAPALFGPLLDGDDIWKPLAALLAELVEALRPDLVVAPQGLGNHVDHRQLITAALAVADPPPLAFYRDAPYAIRNQRAPPDVRLVGLPSQAAGITSGLDRRVTSSCAYATQIGFQFGGPAALDRALRAFAAAEGGGLPAERFLGVLPGFVALPGQAGH
jgi:LmbE family N-acetylglucosaminyl deacetylase